MTTGSRSTATASSTRGGTIEAAVPLGTAHTRSGLRRRGEPREQIERGAGAHLGEPRQLKVAGRRTDVPVPEQSLDRVDVDARFEQVRRKRVAERILTLPMNRAQPSFITVTIRFTANA
jgi:hypothetical protein